MTNTTRIKTYLKQQIQQGHISKRELMNLQTKHLMETTELKDIDQKTIDETLSLVKHLVNPDVFKQDIQKMVSKKGDPLADKINDIMEGYD